MLILKAGSLSVVSGGKRQPINTALDIYFNGASKRPPLEARARLESTFKRIADNRNLTYAQRYLLNTLTSRFTSYRELWRRILRTRGEDMT